MGVVLPEGDCFYNLSKIEVSLLGEKRSRVKETKPTDSACVELFAYDSRKHKLTQGAGSRPRARGVRFPGRQLCTHPPSRLRWRWCQVCIMSKLVRSALRHMLFIVYQLHFCQTENTLQISTVRQNSTFSRPENRVSLLATEAHGHDL